MMRKSRLLNPGFIYVLALEQNRIYIGETSDIRRRLCEHLTGLYYDTKKRKWVLGGSVMTRKYKPIKLMGLYRPELDFKDLKDITAKCSNLLEFENSLRGIREGTERELTLYYMKLHGRAHVRGSRWCSPNKNPNPDNLEKFQSNRPTCQCDIPAERIVTYTGKEKWVCGSFLIHDLFDNKLLPSEDGLLLSLNEGNSIPVSLSCDCGKTAEPVKRFLQED